MIQVDPLSFLYGVATIMLILASRRWFHRFWVRRCDLKFPPQSVVYSEVATDEDIAKWRDCILKRIDDPITIHGRKQVLRFSRDQTQSPLNEERLFQLGYNWAMVTSLATDNFTWTDEREKSAAKSWFWDPLSQSIQVGAWGTFNRFIEMRIQQLGLPTNRPKIIDLY